VVITVPVALSLIGLTNNQLRRLIALKHLDQIQIHTVMVGDKTIPIAVLEDIRNEVHSTTYKQQKLPAAYEALKKSGFTWTSYEER
jgi:hypothetical protein